MKNLFLFPAQLRQRRKNKPAFALLMLLIVVAIGMLIYYFQINPVDFKTKRLQKKDPDTYPWIEDSRIVQPPNLPQQPTENHPQITESIYFETRPKFNDQSCGKIQLSVHPDGMVVGNWAGEYTTISPRANYSIVNADFIGNIDPSKIYTDDQGQNLSKLFFIAKGKYMFLVDNYETGKTASAAGRIYVTGWLNKQYLATGKITITPNKKDIQAFTFSAKPIDQKKMSKPKTKTLFDTLK